MFCELLSTLPERILDSAPFPPASDRKFWSDIPEETSAALLSDGERFLGYDYPSLPSSLFMEFSRTGNRTRFEERYFARRRALNALVLAECVCADGRFLDDIINGIDALCTETAWQLPAHNGYIRDGKQLSLPDTSRPVLDLFACETGAQLAIVSYLLDESLDRIHPSIRERITGLLTERILTPYLHSHFWWMGNGEEPMCNWTPWCTQNILLAAERLSLDQDTLRAIVHKAAYSLDCFLKDYGDDGCCSEGAQYYRHAGLCLFGAIEALDRFAPGVFSPVYRSEKIRNIALYILNVHVDGDYYINFADCSPIAGAAGVREYLFGKRIESEALMRFASEDWKRVGTLTLPDEINLYYRVLAAITAREIAAAVQIKILSTQSANSDVWYPSVGLLVSRSTAFCLAVKAGGNGDSHNHNDTGSFTLYKNGKPCIIDIGVESYTAKTFSRRRYEIWTMQSAWHNLPTFGEWMQHDGDEYRARDVDCSCEGNKTRIGMELAGAWVPESGVVSYRRVVTFDKIRESITIDDRYDGRHPAVMNLMTSLEPVIEGTSLAIGKLARLETDGSQGAISIESVEITDPRLGLAWGERIYRIKIHFGKHLILQIF